MPDVSVVIATYNWSSVLRYSIASALRQTLMDLEVLVVGDGCTDDSEDVARSFGDSRVRWFNLEGNSGSQSRPNNFGIANARGRLIAYHGHDDIWHPSHLEEVRAAIDRDRADLGYSLAIVNEPGKRKMSGVFTGEDFGGGEFVAPSSLMHRRELVEEIGPWRDYRELSIGPDADFIERAKLAGKRFARNPRVRVYKLTSARRRDSYVTRDNTEQAEYFDRILEPAFEREELLDVIRHALRGALGPVAIAPLRDSLPKGFGITEARRARGLEPVITMAPFDPAREKIDVKISGLELPARLAASQVWEGALTLSSASTSTRAIYSGPPAPFYLTYRWHDARGTLVVGDGLRSVIHPVLEPGQTGQYSVAIQAPGTAGTFTLSLCLLQEGVRWFDRKGDSVLKRQVRITE
jgi:GT2 family glycosyltransferase